MTFPLNPADRSPKGDHNRRLALAIDPDAFAAAAGITTQELRDYELTDVDGEFDAEVAERVGATLERLEATRVPRVDNGGVPDDRLR
jgi:hypothetical protein